jgi:hypothetical protein
LSSAQVRHIRTTPPLVADCPPQEKSSPQVEDKADHSSRKFHRIIAVPVEAVQDETRALQTLERLPVCRFWAIAEERHSAAPQIADLIPLAEAAAVPAQMARMDLQRWVELAVPGRIFLLGLVSRLEQLLEPGAAVVVEPPAEQAERVGVVLVQPATGRGQTGAQTRAVAVAVR